MADRKSNIENISKTCKLCLLCHFFEITFRMNFIEIGHTFFYRWLLIYVSWYYRFTVLYRYGLQCFS